MEIALDIHRCPNLARDYAAEFIGAWGRSPGSRLASKVSSGETVDFELRPAEPKPEGEIIWGRVVCREGALAIVSCTVDTPRERELRSRCRDIVPTDANAPPSARRTGGSS